MQDNQYILVFAPNKAGENFMYYLKKHNLRFAALSYNPSQYEILQTLKIAPIVNISNKENDLLNVLNLSVKKVFLFEDSMEDCCRVLQIVRHWTREPLYVITKSNHSSKLYKEFGANYVIYSKKGNVSFLIDQFLYSAKNVVSFKRKNVRSKMTL